MKRGGPKVQFRGRGNNGDEEKGPVGDGVQSSRSPEGFGTWITKLVEK